MEFTRQYFVVAGLVMALIGTTVVVDRPFPLLGAVGLGAWLLASQYRFVRRAERLAATLKVEVNVSNEQVTPDGGVEVKVTVSTDAPAPLEATVSPSVPTAAVGVSSAEPAVLGVGETDVQCSYGVRFPVAGTYRLDPVTISLADGEGYFSTTTESGDPPSVVVEPSALRNLHVGRAGERAHSTIGDDLGPRANRGLEPEGVRAYREGDRASHIDWLVTARTNELHVREFSLDVSGRDAALIVDRRSHLAVGPPGETMLDYARAVGLAYLANARRSATRFNLYFIAEKEVRPAGTLEDDAGSYFRLRQTLEELSAEGQDGNTTRSAPTSVPMPRSVVGRRLGDGGTDFERRLRPFFHDREDRPRRAGSEPVVSAVRTWLAASSPPRETVLVTDDSDRFELRQAIARATGDGGRVRALILPRVLFETGDPGDLDAAYDRYRSFETFRRGLNRRPDVEAFEVGPGDRIEAILAAGAS